MATISHKALFAKLRDDTVIVKATQYAHWTLPQLMANVEQAHTHAVVVERDYQEIGALLTNHLATKLARLLFPTTVPFFRTEASAALLKVANENGIAESEFTAGLARLEMDASKRLFLNASYAQLILALKHLIVTGNVLLHRDSQSSKCTAYGLQSFALRRDGQGNMLDCVLREYTYVEALPPEIQEVMRASDKAKYSRDEQSVCVYTRIKREYRNGVQGHYVSQEVDTISAGEGSWYPAHLCPWFAPTWSLIAGEHYGRGMVEDYAGGFAKLSDLSEAHALYSIEMMRVVHLVGASAGTDIDDLQAAETGEYLRGDPNSVQALESGDAMKLEQTAREIERVYSRLSKAFMYQANVRDAERVTAYELQRDAQEAENALGGVYSALSDGLQVPMAHVLIYETKPESLPGLATGELKLDVVAGIPALGRSSDVQNLLMAAQELAAVLPVSQMDKRFSPQRITDMVLAGRSVDSSQLFFSEEEQKANAEAEAQMNAAQSQMMQSATLADASQQLNTLQGTQ